MSEVVQPMEPEPRSARSLTTKRQPLAWPENQEFRILSIDGGGIRGIFPAAFLAEMEHRYLGGDSVARYFDLIAGTSTGGIIAIGLGAGIPAAKMLQFYMEHGRDIFPSPGRFTRKALKLVRHTYDREKLKNHLYQQLGSRTLRDSTSRLAFRPVMAHMATSGCTRRPIILSYDERTQIIAGDLSFCARYDGVRERLRIGETERASTIQDVDGRICDTFLVQIMLAEVANFAIDWPVVYESGGRCKSIAKSLEIPVNDLHVNFEGICCLGIQIDPGPSRLERFIDQLVVPFFYRVSYIERFGIARARRDLWGEYRHGADGLRDRLREMSSARTGRNSPCACGSGRKYKVCCLRVNEKRQRSLRERLKTIPDGDDGHPSTESRADRRRRSRQR